MSIISILKSAKKELINKIVTSIIIQGLLLVIPIYWSKTINHVSEFSYRSAYSLVIITLVLSILYYLWSYFNQVAWYKFYNKLYLEYTKYLISSKGDNVTLGEYTNIINNDIDIIGTFLGNMVTRFIQILEFIVIYIYFFSINIYIFLITICISLVLIYIIIYYGNIIEELNKKRKETFDTKTINIHSLYNNLKKNNKFINSTVTYLDKNKIFNLFVNRMIYVVLSIIELSRYIIVIYLIYLTSRGKMEIGTILLVYTYYSKILTNFEVLATINAEFKSVKVSIDRINRVKKQEICT